MAATEPPEATEGILILAPNGQDAKLIASAILESRITIATSVEMLCALVREGAASVIVIAEEALTDKGIALLNSALEAQEPWSDIPIVLMTHGGDTTLAVLRINKAFMPSGNLTLLERPFRRITLQSVIHVALRARHKQHEVRDLLQKQVSATRVRDEFISVAGHELRTPLTSLKLQTQMHQRLIAKGDPAVYAPERMRKLVDLTARQVERLSRLIEDMLDISRINVGKLSLTPETFDLTQLVQETVDRLTPQLEAAGCNVELQTQESITGAWDRYRIEQILNNLLVNALQHCPGKPVYVSLSRSDAYATLVVRDEGEGIAPEHQERIFARFERAVRPKAIRGLGLGLYICRQICEAHGGSIRVDSTPGRGSSFIVALPLSPNESVAADKTAEQPVSARTA
jgi:signal transduction histidine kinase